MYKNVTSTMKINSADKNITKKKIYFFVLSEYV